MTRNSLTGANLLPLSFADDIKSCPRCSASIIKMDDGSCNHITCAVCGSEFCWLCMREISDLHYLRYSLGVLDLCGMDRALFTKGIWARFNYDCLLDYSGEEGVDISFGSIYFVWVICPTELKIPWRTIILQGWVSCVVRPQI